MVEEPLWRLHEQFYDLQCVKLSKLIIPLINFRASFLKNCEPKLSPYSRHAGHWDDLTRHFCAWNYVINCDDYKLTINKELHLMKPANDPSLIVRLSGFIFNKHLCEDLSLTSLHKQPYSCVKSVTLECALA
jgi:hypothetical protein